MSMKFGYCLYIVKERHANRQLREAKRRMRQKDIVSSSVAGRTGKYIILDTSVSSLYLRVTLNE